MATFDRLRLRQLDKALSSAKDLQARPVPPEGWVRTVREAIGMSLRQLASRANMSKNAVANVERNEAKGTVRLESLSRLAEAMDCQLVYAVVPRESLEQFVNEHAQHLARRVVGRVSDSMELEGQGTSEQERRLLVDELVARILEEGRLWDE